jgi:hypothetical protein
VRPVVPGRLTTATPRTPSSLGNRRRQVQPGASRRGRPRPEAPARRFAAAADRASRNGGQQEASARSRSLGREPIRREGRPWAWGHRYARCVILALPCPRCVTCARRGGASRLARRLRRPAPASINTAGPRLRPSRTSLGARRLSPRTRARWWSSTSGPRGARRASRKFPTTPRSTRRIRDRGVEMVGVMFDSGEPAEIQEFLQSDQGRLHRSSSASDDRAREVQGQAGLPDHVRDREEGADREEVSRVAARASSKACKKPSTLLLAMQ